MNRSLVAFVGGVLFAIGLVLGGMTNPAKVINFLDFTRNWDPSLAFVMGGAIAIYAPINRLVSRKKHPFLDDRFHPADAQRHRRPPHRRRRAVRRGLGPRRLLPRAGPRQPHVLRAVGSRVRRVDARRHDDFFALATPALTLPTHQGDSSHGHDRPHHRPHRRRPRVTGALRCPGECVVGRARVAARQRRPRLDRRDARRRRDAPGVGQGSGGRHVPQGGAQLL